MIERDLERSARVVCGNGAALYGESTEGQWRHVAQWVGYETWDEVEQAAAGRPFEDVATPRSTAHQRAVAAVQRRQAWERNS